jgi:hypothetical protein
MRAVAITVEGPYSDFNYEGDEIPTWAVAAIDADGETVGTCYTIRSFERAMGLGLRMAKDRRLSFQPEASPA